MSPPVWASTGAASFGVCELGWDGTWTGGFEARGFGAGSFEGCGAGGFDVRGFGAGSSVCWWGAGRRGR
ncbi:hypothetical protein BGM19_38070 [Streptomyces agglomeratus]|nr:hypothetical protein BGM19_38070 [Streptomyces agglomeratus]